MTQMTLMTLNPGYGIGISSKQRHKRHLRHYRHRKKCAGGLGYTPEMCMWMTTCYASKTHLPNLKMFAIKPYIHTYSYIPQSESTVIHPKILTRKSESVLIRLPGHLSEHLLAAQGGKQVPVLPAFEKFPFVVSRKIFLYQHPAEEF